MCSEEITSEYYKYNLCYFKLKIPKKSAFIIRINYNNNYNANYYFYSERIEVKDNNLLGNIKLYNSLNNSLANQIYFTSENLLIENRKTLLYYKADMKYLKPFLEKYKPTNINNIDIKQIIFTLKIFSEITCVPLFLKDLYFFRINFYDYKNIEDNSLFINLNDILIKTVIKEDKNNEIKRSIQNNLSRIHGFIFYKYNKTKFSELIKNEDLFRVAVSRLIGNKYIKINDLVNQKLIENDQIIPFIIENTTSDEDLKNISRIQKIY